MKVFIWTEDHLPPHVHVRHADWEITIGIEESATLLSIKYGRPTSKAIRQALGLVAKYWDEANETWRVIHG